MTWTLTQSVAASHFTTSPGAPAYGSATTAGNLLVASLHSIGNSTAPSLPSGWTQVAAITVTAPVGGSWIFANFNNAGGITSVSITFSGVNFYTQLYEFSCPGVSSVTAADQTGTATSGTVVASLSIVTSGNLTANNELAVANLDAHFSAATVATVGPGTNFTQGGQQNNGTSTAAHLEFDYDLDTGSSSGATFTDAATCSVTGTGNCSGCIATFAQPAVAASGPRYTISQYSGFF